MSLASTLDRHDVALKLPRLAERFDLLDDAPIGRPSGFGAVWRAFDRKLHLEVAIKISDQELASEVRACRAVDGPTVRVYEYFEHDGWYAYAMELLTAPWTTIDGLGDHYRRGRTRALQRYLDGFQIADAILAALDALHGQPYSRNGRRVHADIQPRNVFVCWKPGNDPLQPWRLPAQRGLVKIIDLGLTVLKGEEHRGWHPAYADPRRNLAHHGHDMYSLAIMFLELVCGARPDHHAMGHSARIAEHIAAHPSGSMALDRMAINFANQAARAAANPALTARSLRELLQQLVFSHPPLHFAALRDIDECAGASLQREELVEVIFPIYALHYGWRYRTEARTAFLRDEVLALTDAGLLVRSGQHYAL